VPVLFGRFLGFRQLSGAGLESQHLVGYATEWKGTVRHDNAIGTGSIPKMAACRPRYAGPVGPAFRMTPPIGTSTKS
jgi:hypothetical protein